MARVWAARLHGTRGFRKLVAVKTILPGVMGEDRLEEMFLEEATLASGIHHPNVVDTIELGEHDGTMFMVLEWVDGEPLSLVLTEAAKNGGIPLPIGVTLVAQACKGLQAAHELVDENGNPLGLVHRDISPHNVLVSYSGIVKLLDFGIAKATQRVSSLTEAGEIKGKLAYMAPEQVRGRDVDQRTDLFALGTLLYVITTGRHPWKGDNPGATTERLISDRPVKPPSSRIPDYPAALEAVVLKALEKDPAKRFSSASEMLAALDDAMPSSLEGNAEARVGAFMQGLLGQRGIERRKQIRLAGDLLDLRRASTGAVISSATSGSTSAVAVDTSVSSSGLSQSNVRPSPAPAAPSITVERRRFERFIWVGVAVAFAGCLGLVARRSFQPATDTASRAAAAVAPPPRAPEPAPSLMAADSAAPAPLATATGTAPSDDESDDAARPDKRRRGRFDKTRPNGAIEPRRVVATAQAASAAPEAAQAPAAKTPAPQTSGDAWNPQTFGNRY
jgi:serine/threonine-protein kinase